MLPLSEPKLSACSYFLLVRTQIPYCDALRRLTKFPALSIYWLVLVLPATLYVTEDLPLSCSSRALLTFFASAEVIALSLRTSGISAYLHVQAFTGTMYIVAFLSGTNPLFLDL